MEEQDVDEGYVDKINGMVQEILDAVFNVFDEREPNPAEVTIATFYAARLMIDALKSPALTQELANELQQLAIESRGSAKE